jgi:hypothetical protein
MGINTGALYIIFIMITIIGFGYIMSGPTPSQTPVLTGPEVVIHPARTSASKAMLQLYSFTAVTITPPIANLCSPGGANKNPQAIIAYTPSQSTAISSVDGQISLWVTDTQPPIIASGEAILRSSGAIKTPGDHTARAPDGYLVEPSLYIFPQTVENNGKPYFPTFIKGAYNNGTHLISDNSDILPIDALPTKGFTVEFVWNVASIGLTDGDYNIEFVVHDGNSNLAVKCMSVRIYTPSQAETPNNQLPL